MTEPDFKSALAEFREEHRHAPAPAEANPFDIKEDSLARLRDRYTAEQPPPCRVCGNELTIASVGVGATKFACPVPDGVPFSTHYEHYRESTWTGRRQGDWEVIALLAMLDEFLGESK